MNYLGYSAQGSSEISSIELAILQQDIELPELPEEPLTLDTLEAYKEEGKEYKLMENEYTDMLGNFYVPILFPLIENGESTELEFDAPSTGNILNDSLASEGYIERNFISLVIPKYIVMNFKTVIPTGTKFLVSFTGDGTSLEDINIIGLDGHSIILDSEEEEEE